MMDWFIFCPIRGLLFTCPDDTEGQKRTIEAAAEAVGEIKSEGYTAKDLIIIRGERKLLVSPSVSYKLVDTKAD